MVMVDTIITQDSGQDTVQRFRDYCSLSDDDNILDIGCAKGFMLYDFKELMPGLTVVVIDVSE